MTRFSVLDLVPIAEGSDAASAFRNARDLSGKAERWGYHRYWLAEHHNLPGIGSAATAVLIGFIAEATKSIRVGAGGIMLPNHAPLIVAEQFGTLETLYPGRIDLGVGRDPASADTFPQDVLELQALLGPLEPGQVVQAVPGTGLQVPLWILGSSLFGTQLAAMLGLPYAFASHFAPEALMPALQLYRERFQPSRQLERPYAMVGVNVTAADGDAEARRLFTSAQQHFTNLIRGTRGQLPPPMDDIDAYWSGVEKEQASKMLACSFVGSPETIRTGLERFLAQTGADELIVASAIYNHAARLRSYEILAEVCKALGRERVHS